MRISFYSIVLVIFFGCKVNNSLNTDSGIKIEYLLAGNISHKSADVIIKANKTAMISIKLIEAESRKAVQNVRSAVFDTSDFVIKYTFDNLKPNTRYTYQIQPVGSTSMLGGNFTTFSDKPFSYKFVFGSCLETGSASDIFLKIKAENPLFFMLTGDMHYENIDSNCSPRFFEAYKKTFTSPTQSELYRSTPLVYLWDDHDFGPNNADSHNPCRKESVAAYKAHIPHYPLAFGDESSPISQTFAVGRVQYLLSDLRSQKVRPIYNNCERIISGTNFGDEKHLEWFFNTLLKAKQEGKVVAWVSSYPFINDAGGPNYKCTESDNWGGYPEERARISNFIRDNKIPVFILSGDAHMVAMDDGSNSDYATGGGAPIKVFHAAALDRYGSYKGGPYTEGYSKASGQYGIVEVVDTDKNKVCFRWYAKNKTGTLVKNEQGKEIKMEFCYDIIAN